MNPLTSKILLLASLTALLLGCESTLKKDAPFAREADWISPMQAIFMAAEAAPAAVEGAFIMEVRGSGSQNGLIYLNSESDYRDQRSLTVSISPRAARQLAQRFGQPPRRALEGERILVQGAAARTRIDFISANGWPSGKYYYQTHVRVTDGRQIQVL